MTQSKKVKILALARGYAGKGGVPLTQALLKHSLVPQDLLLARLPETGTIIDLGSGEGILANLVARALPGCRVLGFDLDEKRVAIANQNAPANASFKLGDIFKLPPDLVADAAILNDVVHHQPHNMHWTLLRGVMDHLRPGGVMVLKEVDLADKVDALMTGFFDAKLYPDDKLCFRTKSDWLALFARLGMEHCQTARVKHFWPASRTLFFAERPADDRIPDPEREEAIGRDNLAASQDQVTVFVTGATGFIGGHLCRRLLAKGLDGKPVRLLVLLRDPAKMPPALARAGVVPIVGDLDDLPRLRAALRGVDYVFHLAAEVKLSGGTDIWRNNYQGTTALIEALQGSGVKRLIHASTMGAVDRAPNDPCTRPLKESDPPNPLSEYGRSKLKAEEAVVASGLPYSILRVPWGYGSGMTPDTHVRFLMNGVAQGKPFCWFNFPGRVSLVTAHDLTEAFALLAVHEQALGEVFYVSDGDPISLGQLFRESANIIGRKRAAFINVPRPLAAMARKLRRFMPLTLQGLNSDVLTVDPAKISELGFQPALPRRQGLMLLAQDLEVLPSYQGRLVSVVTGAASGIGLAIARELHRHGHRLLLVDLNGQELGKAARELRAAELELDLCRPDAAERLGQYLDQESYQIDWFVNNAGIGVRNSAVNLGEQAQERVVDLNCRALSALSKLALDHFKRRGVGTLVNIGSTAGFQPLPYMAAYAASKAYVQNYTRSIIGELQDTPGIHVLLANPSGTSTEFQRTAGVKQDPKEVLLAPEQVAREIVDAAYAGRKEVTVGRSGRAMALAARILPVSVQIRLWRRLMKSHR